MKTIKRKPANAKKSSSKPFFNKGGATDFFALKPNNAPAFFNVQPKLNIGQPNDKYEKEADAMADKVVNPPVNKVAVTPSIQEKCADCEQENKVNRMEEEEVQAKPLIDNITPLVQRQEEEEDLQAKSNIQRQEEEEDLQAKSNIQRQEEEEDVQAKSNIQRQEEEEDIQAKTNIAAQTQASSYFESKLRASSNGGAQLSSETRHEMESGFGADFSRVRIHNNTNAVNLSKDINAQAFTHGSDIYFNEGKFDPSSQSGKHLLAHELTHVVQQGQSKPKSQKAISSENVTPSQRRLLQQLRYQQKPNAPVVTKESAELKTSTASRKEPKSIDFTAKLDASEKEAQAIQYSTPAIQVDDKEIKQDLGEDVAIGTKGNSKDDSVSIPKAPTTPNEDPSYQKAKKEIKKETLRQRKHVPASVKKQETVLATAISENNQKEQSAKEKTADEIEETGIKQEKESTKFSAEKFKKDLFEIINAKKPRSESEAKSFAKKPPIDHFEQNFSSGVSKEQDTIIVPLKDKATSLPTGGEVTKKIVDIPTPKTPRAAKPINAKQTIPKKRTNEEISVDREQKRLNKAMGDNKLDENQLANSNEPKFLETLKAKKDAEQKIVEAPIDYRQREEEILSQAEMEGGANVISSMSNMNKVHRKSGKDIHSGQTKTETKTEKRQLAIKEKIDGFYKTAVKNVKSTLASMTTKVKTDFSNSLKTQTETFNKNVKRRIANYYGDWRIDDDLFGPNPVIVNEDGSTRSMTLEEAFSNVKSINPDVYKIFRQEKDTFLKAMNSELDKIALNVEIGLTEAKNHISAAKLAINVFKLTLKGEELIYANQLEAAVNLKFESLEEVIDDTRNDLLEELADQYKENVNQLEKTFNEINDELKKSWIDRAIDFIKTVGKTIFELVELILSILSRVAHLVWDIIKHPIRFFQTLVSGLKEGIKRFVTKMGTHLKQAFWTWLMGANPVKNVTLSANSGVRALFDMVVQTVDLGKEGIRKIVKKVLGKKFLDFVDKGLAVGEKLLEPAMLLLTKGPGALWEKIKDTLSDTIQSTFERIKESVFFSFITKGLKWIAGFFVPGGGFVKVVKAIFSAFQFIAENISNIRAFFDSIFDSFGGAISGSVPMVANKIVQGLKLGVVMALDFLAKQIGLNKIINKVHKIIKSLKKPIVKAITWVLRKIKSVVQKIFKVGKKGVKKVKDTMIKWWNVKKSFKSKDGKQHKIFFKGKGKNATLFVASTPTPIEQFLNKKLQEAQEQKDSAKAKVIKKLLKIYSNDITVKVNEIKGLERSKNKDNKKFANKRITKILNKLRKSINSFANKLEAVSFDDVKDVPTKSMITYKEIGTVIAKPLTWLPGNTRGKSPGSANPPGWDYAVNLNKNYSNEWIRGHLISEKLHGPNDNRNLLPIRRTLNNEMERIIENPAKKAIQNQRNILFYNTVVKSWHSSSKDKRVSHFPKEWNVYYGFLKNKKGEMDAKGEEVMTKSYTFTQDAIPDLGKQQLIVFNINEAGVSQLKKQFPELDKNFLTKMQKERTSSGMRFSSLQNLSRRMVKHYNKNRSKFRTAMSEIMKLKSSGQLILK